MLEIAITLALLSLLALACFNTYNQYAQRKELDATAEAFISNLNYAKEMSIITNQTLYLCATDDEETCDKAWQGKEVIFTSKNPPSINNILKTSPAFSTDIHFEIHMAGFTNNTYLYFMNNGELNNNGHFSFRIGSNELVFTLSKTGIVKQVS